MTRLSLGPLFVTTIAIGEGWAETQTWSQGSVQVGQIHSEVIGI